MQILMKHRNENGYTEGLGFFEGESVKINNNKDYKYQMSGYEIL